MKATLDHQVEAETGRELYRLYIALERQSLGIAFTSDEIHPKSFAGLLRQLADKIDEVSEVSDG